MFDDTDRRILRQLQEDPTISTAQLADRAGVNAATCWRRLERLRERGVLRGARAVIDWQVLGFTVEVSLRVTLDKTVPRAFEDFAAAAREIPEVLEIQTFLGQVDVRLGLIARDLAHYQALYRDSILTLPHINDLEALMHVARIKTDETVPL
ncbi:transcriptional regulator, AsnC family [Pseudooceanicola nitratireducens]|jgi:Lrp/AsnC family transcriptional regulator|uniref:Transcriptional regulator, AsnC family n=1 Tax=Pseudooceanicola nitratireducens TaxID=517719 RepID=A0A1I1JWT1_9RHOB|nr:Lrp/AsnC family transcriptional regulator [Pseudooceanicola nitratireducens]SEJ51383.1 Lrp/AsnC family transcriptional regulator [Pseudooceanicola nitratireducens]SFC52711.1 transcriptional regulator, AsnC family [Pseudooceanicola nitratireducens]